jgi:hypothetical protein
MSAESSHTKAVALIDTAISTLATGHAEMHLVYSNAAYTAVNVSHELQAITGDEFKRYCERIRDIDALFMGASDARDSA